MDSDFVFMYILFLIIIGASIAVGSLLRRMVRGDQQSKRRSNSKPRSNSSSLSNDSSSSYGNDARDDRNYDDRPDWQIIEEREAKEERIKEDWENSPTKKFIDFLKD